MRSTCIDAWLISAKRSTQSRYSVVTLVRQGCLNSFSRKSSEVTPWLDKSTCASILEVLVAPLTVCPPHGPFSTPLVMACVFSTSHIGSPSSTNGSHKTSQNLCPKYRGCRQRTPRDSMHETHAQVCFGGVECVKCCEPLRRSITLPTLTP